ncbi:MAG TPA: iron-regulated protein [Bacteroidales bacterium]|nr:MAG: iron-regulated protein [Bacteroidetes bacterium GWF2_33_38]OFY74823.1 MAG: iron-regulated protein [Bacteroidetes bacterium RIFOXYA12_FULL_33_9]OFY88296.1 MAG: iron-regulated protein [Bacteroidetes bacterium RIFOXYA2_FULL_33_7]HBF87771.1 iron-regulated protein [Bacteroidales bacterium]
MKILAVIIMFVLSTALVSDKPAYNLFDKSGKEVAYKMMIDELNKADVVFFGELHNNSIAHWLQFEITKDLYTTHDKKIVLGAEMFESDNQLIMNEYLKGIILEPKFEEEARLWPNYETDYKPLVNFAKENNLNFVACNIPRRYASVVFSGGFEALNNLSNEAKQYIAPLPIEYNPELKCYKDMTQMSGGMGHKMTNENLPKAQAAKDATMAHFIAKNHAKGSIFIHYNGSYHSDNYQGIITYLKKTNPELKIATITTVESNDLTQITEEAKQSADFIINVNENVTKTH